MTTYVGFLRAVNVGGTGSLPMSDLRAVADACGFSAVRGNVLFGSDLSEADVCRRLEGSLADHVGATVDVIIRNAGQLADVVARNPFPDAPGSKVAVVLGRDPIEPSLPAQIVAPGGEEVAAGVREVYIHYPDGMGRSKLKLPRHWAPVTARNMNSMTRLAELTGSIPSTS
jgi:uncharacterized protein (DUF1697 family)